MDAKTLQTRLDLARSFTHEVGGITFRCRLLPHLRMTAINMQHEGTTGGWIRIARDILAETVLGMRGATTEHLGLEGAEPLDDSQEAALMLLDERTDIALDLAAEIGNRSRARRNAIQADEKN